ncbi:FecCD family ABC transporter permease [Pseudactinotalea sp. Z1739]|uniref:FecCD family ABC transporter permease n=1 Tax=Pseudactinotalea sp. Z1739 TaxID=3413028 RepID=UPI003C7AADAD
MTDLASPPRPTTQPPEHVAAPAPRVARRALWLAVGATLALVLAAGISVSLGTLRLDPVAAVRAVFSPDDSQVATVVWAIRLPRIVVAMLVGAALAGVGVVMQAVFRNPLADPGVTGVSSGAAVGAVAGITAGLAGSLQWGVPIAAFTGALVVALLLQAVLHTNRGASTYTLILVGVSINAFAGALISILVANAHDDALARGAVFWLAGDLELRTWNHAAIAVIPIALGLGLLLTRTRALDALLLGDDVTSTSGYNVHRTRLVLLLIASLVTGAAVAVSGVISFVGLVVPHAVRLVIGAKHALLLPISIVGGALFLVLADTAARAASVTIVVQTGAVAALIGAPVFLALLLSRRHT